MFDPASFLALEDRHPVYKMLRDGAPVFKADFGPVPVWILTRYDDVAAVLRNPQARVKPPGRAGAPPWLGNGAAAQLYDAQLVLSDPPDHDRLRRLASPGFTPRTLKPLEAWVETMVAERVEHLAGVGAFDLITDLAAYVPGTTILHILGVPSSDWEALISRVPGFLHIFAPFPIGEAERAACDEACGFYLDYFGAIIDERRKNPGDDIIGSLITAHEDDDRLSRLELLALLQAFLNAGFETTMSTLGAGMYGMLSQGEPWQRLVAEPALAPVALEEVLRYEAPVSFVQRFPVEDIQFHGQTIQAGEPVLLALASANRDERRFENPDRIDIDRPRKDHLSFGGGRHFCIGFQLAKLEARTTLAAIARRMPNLRLDGGTPKRQANMLFHSIEQLPVSVLEAAAAASAN